MANTVAVDGFILLAVVLSSIRPMLSLMIWGVDSTSVTAESVITTLMNSGSVGLLAGVTLYMWHKQRADHKEHMMGVNASHREQTDTQRKEYREREKVLREQHREETTQMRQDHREEITAMQEISNERYAALAAKLDHQFGELGRQLAALMRIVTKDAPTTRTVSEGVKDTVMGDRGGD